MGRKYRIAYAACTLALCLAACTQESQNRISRSIQNWTGTDGVLDIYAGDKLVKRFIKIDKMSTALGTGDRRPGHTAMVTGISTRISTIRWTRGRRRSILRSAIFQPTFFMKTRRKRHADPAFF